MPACHPSPPPKPPSPLPSFFHLTTQPVYSILHLVEQPCSSGFQQVSLSRAVLELTASQRRKGFEPEGYSLYQRLIAASEQGTAPKQTLTAVKTGSGPNDVGQQGFFTARPLWRRLPEMDKQQDMSCQRQQQQQETDLAAL
ncbi:hypothetical protein Q5P01_006784 [Channa striata]|uniref:Uncharacterized protein n=1 Tax=Channa striata TaxID=64152 RepID=A0AA88NIB7_CHASR|nr:hypothetical protein Q5P01_006784 [Channa striata]